jgi:hypothetical protein
VEFAFTGVIAGIVAGTITGLVVGLLTKPNLLITEAFSLTGFALGGLLEAIHFWWRRDRARRVRDEQKSHDHSSSSF